MTKAKHTPTPWKIEFNSKCEIVAKEGTIATLDLPMKRELGYDGACLLEEANASFIVKAVNSHEALVEALKLARVLLGGFEDYPGSSEAKKIEEALKQAEAL